jgi:ribonuclease HI
MKITIHTDGSSRFNPGPSGWGAILSQGDYVKEISCGYRLSTNNRMELMAVIEAIKMMKKKGLDLEIYSDSAYVVNSIEKGWVFNWAKTNFKDRVNADLWRQFVELYTDFNITMIWVKGHASNEGNNRCDTLATLASSDSNKDNWRIDEAYEKSKK